MKYSIVAAALFSSVLAAPGWGPPGGEYGHDEGSWGTSAAPVYSSAAPSAPAYGWSSSAAPVYSSSAAPVPSSPCPSGAPAPSYPAGSSAAPAPSYPAGGWGSSAAPVPSYPAGSSAAPYPVPSGSAPVYPTGTAAPYPSQSTWAPVPATGAGSTAQTGGILAAAGALVALFL